HSCWLHALAKERRVHTDVEEGAVTEKEVVRFKIHGAPDVAYSTIMKIMTKYMIFKLAYAIYRDIPISISLTNKYLYLKIFIPVVNRSRDKRQEHYMFIYIMYIISMTHLLLFYLALCEQLATSSHVDWNLDDDMAYF
ncbi:hypothetical protein ACJX0J_028585, partial [Zea mays]